MGRALCPLGEDPLADRLSRAGLIFAEGRQQLFKAEDGDPRIEDFARFALSNPTALDRYPGDFGFLLFASSGDAVAVRSCG